MNRWTIDTRNGMIIDMVEDAEYSVEALEAEEIGGEYWPEGLTYDTFSGLAERYYKDVEQQYDSMD